MAYEAEEQTSPTSTGKVTNRYYYHLNQLGSVIALSSSTGAVLIKYSYDSFGLSKVLSGSTLIDFRNYTGNKYSNVRLFTGREHDRETGYYYMRARYYNAENSGRFINRDPIGQNDQVNLYTYVANSPLKYVDRMGREKVLILVGKSIKTDDDYAYALAYQIQKYLDQGVKPQNILMATGIYTPKDFNNATQQFKGNLQDVVYLSHGSENSLGGGLINKENVKELKSLKSSPGEHVAKLTLIACNTGRGINPIAQDIANQLGIQVDAPNGYLDIGGGEGAIQMLSIPGMFDPFRKNGEPSFANFSNLENYAKLNFNLGINTFNPTN